MDKYCNISLLDLTPLVTTAIHDGHELSDEIRQLIALNDAEQLREEDPYTGIWAGVSKNHITGIMSRFEFDLNRPPEKAIYLTPEDAWGLQVWKHPLSGDVLERSRNRYAGIYRSIHAGISRLVERFGTVVILDLHSYNHRRRGPDAPPDDPALNPEINVGTGTMDRTLWTSVVDRLISDLQRADFFGRHLDVRENVKFKGGYFPRWIHENFSESVCCISLEFKKFFMDEWTGEPDWQVVDRIEEVIVSLVPGLLEEITMRGFNTRINSQA